MGHMMRSRTPCGLLSVAAEYTASGSSRRAFASVAKTSGPASASISPSSSSSSSSSWKPPIAPGTEPAYDEAVKFISEQQATLRQQIPSLKAEAEKLPPGSQERKEAEARWHSFEVASSINDPEVRWRFSHDATVPLSSPVFAHLRQQSWRRQVLPKIIERIQLMKVLPDVIPSIIPSVDVQVAFGQGSGIHDHGGDGGDVLVGSFVDARQTLQAPTITATPFHADERLYTLALVDADTPYKETDRIASKGLWLVHNIPLSLTRNTIDFAAADTVLPYLAPHPARGTPYHRFALVLLEQPARIQAEALKQLANADREHYSVNQLMSRLDLSPAGIHFWRAIWSEASKGAISSVYKDVLGESEPHFIRPN